jgi:hypothetical protein
MSEDWRKRLRNMRTLAGLKREDADASALDGLDADALRAAADNPDHSEAGRALAASRAPAGRWRLAVPGFVNARDLARGQALFFGWGRVLRKWSGLAFYLAFVAMIIAAGLMQQMVERAQRDATEQIIACEYRSQCAGMPAIGAARDSAAVEPSPPPRQEISEEEFRAALNESRGLWIEDEDAAAQVAGPVGILLGLPLLIWFLASALRRKPARVLLLRKFNVRAYSEPLERAISNEFRPFGHIASLSDKFIRRDTFGWVSTAVLSLGNPLALAWFVIGAPIRFVYRLFDRSGMGPAVVLNARDFRNLARRLRDRIGLNLQVAFTSKEAFLVRTSDAWWRQVIRLFFDSSDVILVDLTKVTAGTAWELDTIRDENLAARCVFIALWGQVEEAQAALAARGLTNACHAYAPDGHMVDRQRFRAAMLGAMSATHPS